MPPGTNGQVVAATLISAPSLVDVTGGSIQDRWLLALSAQILLFHHARVLNGRQEAACAWWLFIPWGGWWAFFV